MMNDLTYKNGHGLSEKLIRNILENLKCSEIKNIDYNDKKEFIIASKGGLRPDFICNYANKETAVEVGKLNNEGNCISKVHKMLQYWDIVIHIFPDQKFLFLHCIVYEKKNLMDSKYIESIQNQKQLCSDLLKDFENKNKIPIGR
jgi:hypothetical protein